MTHDNRIESSEKLLAELRADFVERFVKELTDGQVAVWRRLVANSSKMSAKDLTDRLDSAASDPSSNTRKALGEIRWILALFALKPEGKMHSLQVDLPKNEGGRSGYHLVFTPRDVEAKKCWYPYLSGRDQRVLIVYTEPQFFRLDEHAFVRHQDVNSDTAAGLRRACPWLNHGSPKSSRHFVSSGETDAVLALTQWFERLGVRTEYLTAHQWSQRRITHRNVILFGNKRTFPEMAELVENEDFDYLIQEHHIENRKAESPLERELPDDFTGTKPVKGVVSRFYNHQMDSHVTCFASNHGRFFEAAVRALTSNHENRLLWRELKNEDSMVPPERFELIGEARVSAHEEAARSHSIKWIQKQCKGAVVNR